MQLKIKWYHNSASLNVRGGRCLIISGSSNRVLPVLVYLRVVIKTNIKEQNWGEREREKEGRERGGAIWRVKDTLCERTNSSMPLPHHTFLQSTYSQLVLFPLYFSPSLPLIAVPYHLFVEMQSMNCESTGNEAIISSPTFGISAASLEI